MNKRKKRGQKKSNIRKKSLRRASLKRKTMKRKTMKRKTMNRRNNRKTMNRRNNRKTMKRKNNRKKSLKRKTLKRRSQRGGGEEEMSSEQVGSLFDDIQTWKAASYASDDPEIEQKAREAAKEILRMRLQNLFPESRPPDAWSREEKTFPTDEEMQATAEMLIKVADNDKAQGQPINGKPVQYASMFVKPNMLAGGDKSQIINEHKNLITDEYFDRPAQCTAAYANGDLSASRDTGISATGALVNAWMQPANETKYNPKDRYGSLIPKTDDEKSSTKLMKAMKLSRLGHEKAETDKKLGPLYGTARDRIKWFHIYVEGHSDDKNLVHEELPEPGAEPAAAAVVAAAAAEPKAETKEKNFLSRLFA